MDRHLEVFVGGTWNKAPINIRIHTCFVEPEILYMPFLFGSHSNFFGSICE